jgi:hypothetical protein
MRAFGLLGLVITLAIGMYFYSTQVKTLAPSTAAAGGNPQDITTVTGVKNDLISIANAERGYMASQGKYASLDELISGNYITIKSERPPYIYNIEASGTSFRATATRTTKGYPTQLSIGDDMQVQSSN